MRWLCISASQGLGLPNQLAQYWDEKYSTSKVNCTDYFEQYLLAKLNSPLVLCLDEVDRVFPYPELAQEFLSLLRAWHEQAKIRNIWKNLRLVIVHSTEVYIPLNINESPFNVGLAIELPEFNPGQVLSLAQQYELNWSEAEVKQLMDRVGGHPHLIEQALSHLRTHRTTSLSQLLAKASTNEGIYKDHLRRIWVMIQRHPDLVEAMRSVVTTTTSVRLEIMQAYKLHSIGLVSLSGSEVFPRCALYQEYFCNLLRDAV